LLGIFLSNSVGENSVGDFSFKFCRGFFSVGDFCLQFCWGFLLIILLGIFDYNSVQDFVRNSIGDFCLGISVWNSVLDNSLEFCWGFCLKFCWICLLTNNFK
jgi:hypothetical protein